MVRIVSWNSNGRIIKTVAVVAAAAVSRNSRGKTVRQWNGWISSSRIIGTAEQLE